MNRQVERKEYHLTYIWLIICILTISSCSSKNGCTDTAATNFNESAKFDDSTCVFPTFDIKPDSILDLKTKFNENSGLLWSNNRIWTHTDGGGETKLFSIDTSDGGEKENIFLSNTLNTDWEDIAQDQEYFYVGDFGNNSGNRTDLVVYKFRKTADSLIKNNNKTSVEEIHFHYPDQTDFRKDLTNNFDCEAMIVKDGFVYLFTKRHKDLRTRLYRIPAIAGDYTADLRGQFYSKGVITGADISPSKQSITLTGYNPIDNSAFLWVMRNFKEDQFFNSKKFKVNLGLRTQVGQIEGVCYYADDSLYLSNENYQTIPPTLYKINISQVK